MGMLKRMKDMKDMVNAAPGMVAQGQQLAAQAQQMAAAQQAAAQAQLAQAQQAGQFGHFGGSPASGQPGVAPTGPDFDAIAGVSLEEFAAVSKAVAAYNYDAAKLPEIAESRGIPAASWEQAAQGWNSRLQANPAVAHRFNQLYRES